MPAAITEQAAAYHAEAVKAEAAYRAASEQLKRFEVVHGDRAAHLKGALRSELIDLRRAAHPPRLHVPALPRSAVKVRGLFDRLGRVIGISARTIDERVVEGIAATPYAPVTIKTDAGRGVLTVLGERQNEYPGRRAAAGLDRAPTRTAKWPRRCSATSGRSPKRAQDARLPRRAAGHDRRPGGSRVLLRPLPARRAGRGARRGQRRRPAGSQQARADAAARRAHPADDARPGPAEGERKGAARRHRTRARRRQTGDRRRVRGDRPAQRRSPRDRLLSELRPEQVRQTADPRRIRRTDGRGNGEARTRSPTGPTKAPIRPARRSSRSPRWRRSKPASSRPTKGSAPASASTSRPSSSATPATPTTAPSGWSKR